MILISSPRFKLWVAFGVVVLSFSIQAQTKTNLEIFKVLVDSSISEIFDKISNPQKDIYLNLKLGASYNIFEDQIIKSFQIRGQKTSTVNNSLENLALSYTIENTSVNYGEIFRDGFFGDNLVQRKISITGTYWLQVRESMVKNFYYENSDTINVGDIQELDNSSYPLTKGKIPSEPFLSNLFEPVIAIATAAVVITLFFTVRSK